MTKLNATVDFAANPQKIHSNIFICYMQIATDFLCIVVDLKYKKKKYSDVNGVLHKSNYMYCILMGRPGPSEKETIFVATVRVH